MWTRAELKTRAKALFKMNYWKAVLAALLLSVLAGAGSGGFSGSGASLSSLSSGFSAGLTSSYSSESAYNSMNSDDFEDLMENGNIYDVMAQPASRNIPPVMGLMFAGMMTVIILIAAAVAIAVNILLINPLTVGIRRFFTRNLYEKAQIRELAFGFDHSYKNVIHVMFFRDLFTFLWSLLFIIPGIVKSYSYRLVPYIIAENPSMDQREAFRLSREMMNGEKWNAFVLDLSFIGWMFLGALTLGILDIFYVCPYKDCTDAELYITLKEKMFPRDAA